MIRGLKSKFAKSNSSTNVAAGSGAQGASVINTSKVGNPDTSAAAAAPDEGEAVEPKRTGSSSSKAIVAAEDPAGNGWAYEDVWSYVDSMGVTKIPGEEHILRFLADCLHASPLPAPWAVHKDGEGRVFYGNSGTGETTWEHPLEEIIRELAGVCRVCVTLSRPMRERSIVDLREAWEAQAKEEFALWYSVKDSTTSKDYFCNSQTGQTMWEHPAEVLLPGHFLKLRAADRLIDDEYLQDLATMGSTLNEGSGQTWNSMKRTLESGISTRASNDVKDDAHQAMKEELASTATELRAAREDAAKVRAQFEALKERFEEAKRNAENEEMLRSKAEARLEQEQQKLEGVQKDFDILKDKFDQAQRNAQDVELKHSQAEAKLQEEQQKLQSAVAECEALKQQQQASNESSADAQATIKQELAATTEQLQAAKNMLAEAQRNAQEVEVKRSQVQVQLETEQQRLQSAISECEAWKQQAKAQESKSSLDAAESERRAVVQTVVSEDATHADQALRRQIESARQVELQLESKASAAKASLEEEHRRVEQLKLEYTNLLQGQQDTVQASQKHLETKLEELGYQMREMRSTWESGRITSNQDDLAKQLAQVSAVNAKLETAVVELQLESKASAAKASLEEERRRVEQLKLEYTKLLQRQQDTVQASQKHVETKLEELGYQMREMRSTLESGRITSNQDDLAKQLAEVSAVNAKLETAVAKEAKSLGPARPVPIPLKAAPSEDVRPAKSPKRSAIQEAALLKRGREPRVREFDGKMWARTDDAVLTGQRVRHLMLESLAARQQTRMYKEMIQEFDASEMGQKAKLSSAKAALQSLNSSLRGQVEQARRELEQLEKARQAGPVLQT